MALGKVGAGLFQQTQGIDHLRTCPCLHQRLPTALKPIPPMQPPEPADLTRERWKMAPDCLLLQESQPGQTELRDPRQGDVSHYPSTRGMATLP